MNIFYTNKFIPKATTDWNSASIKLKVIMNKVT